VAADRVLKALCVTLGVVMVAQGVLQTLLVPFVRDVLHFDAPSYGVVSAAQGVGALLGALGLGAIGRHVTSGRVLGAGLVLAGAFLAVFTAVRPLPLSAAAMFLFTVPVVIAAVWIQTYYQRHVSGDLLGRVIGLTETTSSVGILAGVVAASLLGGRGGTVPLLLASAAVLVAAGVAAGAVLWDASTTVPEPIAPAAGAPIGGGAE
jgi:predicted MFS family arabinose efflux permease